MIKIAFVIDTIESPTAGTEKQLLMLIKHMDRSKFLPYLCVLQTSEWLKKKFVDCQIIEVGVRSFRKPSSYLNILKFSTWLKNQNIDIVQTHFKDGNKVGVLAGRLAGVRTIVATRRNQGYWHNRREIQILYILNKWVTSFLANSESTKRWVAKTEKIDTRLIKVIYNSLEIDHFYRGTARQRADFREQLDFPGDAVIIGIVANLRPVKAIDHFLRAARIVSENCNEARFIIVGDGIERLALETLCKELKIESLVGFLGRQINIPKILSCIDIGVLSSSSESFSNSLIEYMAAELAVVCTDVGGVREVVEDGLNGYVVEWGDVQGMAGRLTSIIRNGTYRKMGCEGKAKVFAMFSHMDVFFRYHQFYEELARGSARN